MLLQFYQLQHCMSITKIIFLFVSKNIQITNFNLPLMIATIKKKKQICNILFKPPTFPSKVLARCTTIEALMPWFPSRRTTSRPLWRMWRILVKLSLEKNCFCLVHAFCLTPFTSTTLLIFTDEVYLKK